MQASKAKGNIKVNLMMPVISNAIYYDYCKSALISIVILVNSLRRGDEGTVSTHT